MTLAEFLAELRRRRVLRVAGAYLIGAWVAVQVANVLAPALALPEWTVTLVVALAIIGFPAAIVLAWAFDITPAGVERTASRRPGRKAKQARAGAGQPHARAQAQAGGGAPWLAGGRGAAALALVAVLVAGGWFAVRARGPAVELDANALVVIPFRVSGDASHDYLREGMVDLLAAKFTGQGGPRAVDARTSLSAWRRAANGAEDDLGPPAAVGLARQLGAAQVLLGGIVATPSRMTIAATLHGPDGAVKYSAEVDGHPDSLVVLVDRLAGRLLAAGAGEDRLRLETLTSASLPALRAYLAGQAAYRLGHFQDAARHFREAVDADSTFALASIGLFNARGWSGYGPDYQRGRRLAWAYRDRLPPRDREFVLARLSSDFEGPHAAIDQLRGWEAFVQRHPDRVEAWYELGDRLFHEGGVPGYTDAMERAIAAFERALQLDPDFAPARAHAMEGYALLGDTARLRREAAIYFENAPQARYASQYGWLVAHLLGDEEALRRIRDGFDNLDIPHLNGLVGFSRSFGIGHDDARRALDRLEARLAQEAPVFTAHRRMLFELNSGRPAAAGQVIDRVMAALRTDAFALWHVIAALYPDADAGIARSTANMLAARAEPLSDDEELRSQQVGTLCAVGEWRARNGEMETARRFAELLRAESQTGDADAFLHACAVLIEASIAVGAGRPDADALLVRLDSLLINAYIDAAPLAHFNFAAMRLHRDRGNAEAALAAVRRRDHYEAHAFAPMLLERARLHVQLGQRDEAVRFYSHFLALRPDPEPGPPTELTNAARAELARLVREPGS